MWKPSSGVSTLFRRGKLFDDIDTWVAVHGNFPGDSWPEF